MTANTTPLTVITATRYHDFSCGHRVCGHESKCAFLHGHNYRVTFTIEGKLDYLGRVLDFSVIKSKLCEWLEEKWDHRCLIWEQDPWFETLGRLDPLGVVGVTFNPTAENMAEYLLNIIGPMRLSGTGAKLVEVRVEETRKCAAIARLN